VTRAALAAVLVLGVGATGARASFTAPVALSGPSPIEVGGAADTDAAGTTTALVGGSRFAVRPRGGAWSAPARFPGRPAGAVGAVLDAAGAGALGIAWRVDRPRRYAGIGVALRDPGGAVSEPIAIAGDDAGGVRHPAIAVDADGDALVAYDTATRKTHLSLQGRIAVAYRRAGGSFSKPVVVERDFAGAPVVALAPDGTGIVAWVVHGRLRAVSIAADGRAGKAKTLALAPRARRLMAAADRGGAATIAWAGRRELGRRQGTRYAVQALRRAAGHGFGSVETVASSGEFIGEAALAADDGGRVTLVWTEFGPRSTVGTASARPGRPFGVARTIVARRDRRFGAPAIAAAGGRAVLAWSFVAGRRHVGVQAAVGPAGAPGSPQTVADTTVPSRFFLSEPHVAATIDPQGPATVLFGQPSPAPNDAGLQWRLVASDGQ